MSELTGILSGPEHQGHMDRLKAELGALKPDEQWSVLLGSLVAQEHALLDALAHVRSAITILTNTDRPAPVPDRMDAARDLITKMIETGASHQHIAEALNNAGLPTSRGLRWSAQSVSAFRRKMGLPSLYVQADASEHIEMLRGLAAQGLTLVEITTRMKAAGAINAKGRPWSCTDVVRRIHDHAMPWNRQHAKGEN